MRKSTLVIFLLAVCKSSAMDAEQYFEIGSRLEAMGFEHVAVLAVANGLLIEYENRVFVNEVYAAGVVLGIATKSITETPYIWLAPRVQGIEVGKVRVPAEVYQQFINGAITIDEMAACVAYHQEDSKSGIGSSGYYGRGNFLHGDIVLYPGLVTRLGNYDDAYKINFNLVPELHLTLWQGACVHTRVTIPVVDEISIYTMEPRLSRFSFQQFFRFRQAVWAHWSIGIFDPDRWGLSGQMGVFFNNARLFIGIQYDYTGFFLHQKQTIHYSPLGTSSGKVFGSYFFPSWDLRLGCGYAKYLYGDFGPYVEIARKFIDVDIGFFAASTNLDQFAGINLKVPFPPKKHFRPRRIRVHWPFYYQWRFQATSETQTQGEPLQTGVEVQAGQKLEEIFEEFNLSLIRNNISLWRDAYNYVANRFRE